MVGILASYSMPSSPKAPTTSDNQWEECQKCNIITILFLQEGMHPFLHANIYETITVGRYSHRQGGYGIKQIWPCYTELTV